MNNEPKIPRYEDRRNIDQLRMNLKNLYDTAKIVAEAIKRREAELERKYK